MNRTEEWNKARARLKILFEASDITICEVRLKGCMINNFLSFAHYKPRRFYYDKPGKVGDFDEVLLLCQRCHQFLDLPENRDKLEYYFNKLRG